VRPSKAARLHVAQNSSFLTAVEFYGQRKLPDIPRKSAFQTGLEWLAERSWRLSCGNGLLFSHLCFRLLLAVSVCLSVLARRAWEKITSFLLFGTAHYGNRILGLTSHLIPPHHRLIQHSLITGGRAGFATCTEPEPVQPSIKQTPSLRLAHFSYHQSKTHHRNRNIPPAFSFCLLA
jgi:hypothetical protein